MAEYNAWRDGPGKIPMGSPKPYWLRDRGPDNQQDTSYWGGQRYEPGERAQELLEPVLPEKDLEGVTGGIHDFARDWTSSLALAGEAAAFLLPWYGAAKWAKRGWQAASKPKKAAMAAGGATAAAPLAIGAGGIIGDAVTTLADPELSAKDKTYKTLLGAELAMAPFLGMGSLGKNAARRTARKIRGQAPELEIPSPSDAEAVRSFHKEASENLPPAPDREANIKQAYENLQRSRAAERSQVTGNKPEIEELGKAIENSSPATRERSLPGRIWDRVKLTPAYAVHAAGGIRIKPKDWSDFWLKTRSDFSQTGRQAAILDGFEEFVSDNFTGGYAAIGKNPNKAWNWWIKAVDKAGEKTGYRHVFKGTQHDMGLNSRKLNHGLSKRIAGWRALRGDVLFSSLKNNLEQLGRGGQEILQGITRYHNAISIQGTRFTTTAKEMMKHFDEGQLQHVLAQISGSNPKNLPELDKASQATVSKAMSFWEEYIDTPMREWAARNGVTDFNIADVVKAAPESVADDQFMSWMAKQFRNESGLDPSQASLLGKLYSATKRIAMEQELRSADAPMTNWLDEQIGSIRSDFGDGTGISGWRTLRPGGEEGWYVEDGVLKNHRRADVLVSEQAFWNFRLQVEYLVHPGMNGGIGLRGRYEIQILDDYGRPASDHGNAALYGRIAPTENASRPAREWQSLDVRLVGRELTVELNGVKTIDRKVIDGFTAMATDWREDKPGPITLQGDHGAVEFRKIVVTPLTQ